MKNEPGASRALILATISFALAFAVWGLLSGLAPLLKQHLHLTRTQVSLMIAIPVLLGSIGRLPMGLLADRFGAKPVMSALMIFLVVPALLLARAGTYNQILALGFFLGLAGTSFSVGVAMVSPWFPRERQGTALGIFGAGNIGQSIAVFGGPVLAVRFGLKAPFVLFGLLACAWGFVVLVAARTLPRTRPRLTLAEAVRPLHTEPLSWLFSLFYFVTFGGFVALGIYLPSLLKEIFSLTPSDAGARTAGFVLIATAARPLGGWLSDRIGGEKVLLGVFAALAILAYGLSSASMPVFTVAALALAFCLGLGNGSVFKLVPQKFPEQVGTVTGLVGMWGGLGGFFPPLILGILKDRAGSYSLGFLLLSLFAAVCMTLDYVVLVRRSRPRIAASATPSLR